MTRTSGGRSILVIDDDEDIGEVISVILGQEGYNVRALAETSLDAVRTAIAQLEPDLILMDGAGRSEYGEGWIEAAWVRKRRRRIPVIMLTGHAKDAHEAEGRESKRAQAAGFAAVLLKPFDLDNLLDTVSRTVSDEPFNRGDASEQARTASLVGKLRSVGAADVRASTLREWATFALPPDERVYQLFWLQSKGQYLLGAYSADGVFERLGTFWELGEALAACAAIRGSGPAPPA